MSKRGNSEGSIYQRKSDGKWCAAVTLDGSRRKVLYGDTRQEVARKLTAALQARQQNLPLPNERLTVAAFLGRWLAEIVAPTTRPKTCRFYEQIVRGHLIPELGRFPLAQLGPEQVQAMLNRKRASGLSARSVYHLRAVLRTALGRALKWGLVARNAAALADPPRVADPGPRLITKDQARMLLAAFRGNRLEALYVVALSLGLRQGEALALRWEDVDLERQTLRVEAAMQRVDRTLQRVEPKTQRSRRTIPLPGVAVEALRAHRVRQIEERLLAGDRWREHGLVFTTSIGTPLDGVTVTHRFQKLLDRAGLPRLRFHDLRHGAASLLAAQEVPARVAMELLGHSDIRTTLNVYTHVAPELAREAVRSLDVALRG